MLVTYGGQFEAKNGVRKIPARKTVHKSQNKQVACTVS